MFRRLCLIVNLVAVGLVLMTSPAMIVAQNDSSGATVEVLVQGSPMRGSANGIFFDNQDRLLVASALGNAIFVVDPESGDILETWGPEQGVTFPDDVTVGPDDSVYFTDTVIGNVIRISAGGTVTTLAQGLPNVNPITLSDDGRLYVAQCFGEMTGVYEIIEGADPWLIVGDQPHCATNAMDIGPDGMLYGPRWFEGRIVKIDPASGEITTVLEGLEIPSAAKFSPDGVLHVLDAARGEVLTLDIVTGESIVLTTMMPGMDNLAFDSAGRLYVSSYVAGSIVEVLADGTIRTVVQGGLVNTSGIAVQNGTVYTGGFYGLKGFDAISGEMTFVSPNHLDLSPVGSPLTVSSDGDNLLLSSWFNNTEKLWSPTDDLLAAEFADPAVPLNALRFQGDLILAQIGTSGVVRVNGEDPSQIETLIGDLAVPTGLAATDDDLWVADWATGTVWLLIEDGVGLSAPVAAVTGLMFPEGIAVTSDGQLIVVETGLDRVVAIDLSSGELVVLAEGLQLSEPSWPGIPVPPSMWFNGVAVDENGVIYVNADLANVIYRILPQE